MAKISPVVFVCYWSTLERQVRNLIVNKIAFLLLLLKWCCQISSVYLDVSAPLHYYEKLQSWKAKIEQHGSSKCIMKCPMQSEKICRLYYKHTKSNTLVIKACTCKNESSPPAVVKFATNVMLIICIINSLH